MKSKICMHTRPARYLKRLKNNFHRLRSFSDITCNHFATSDCYGLAIEVRGDRERGEDLIGGGRWKEVG